MTNLTPEQIKEAVELAKGWYITDEVIVTPANTHYLGTEPECLAALASQLKSQVDSMRFKGSHWHCVQEWHNHSKVMRWDADGGESVVTKQGPNRNDNSILACMPFLKQCQSKCKTHDYERVQGVTPKGDVYCVNCKQTAKVSEVEKFRLMPAQNI